ncbi:MAG: oxygen-independent coproporphyrinogen III oxidase [Nitrosomonadales bacterium]|nr:oxygen-independent coproporphyrinogen III oxidase [Nitrosomonadales bacterium]MBT6014787.1 oxygen-independent coproporphyrinogen III oxidase [Nitrosomonadales bacterium]MBT7120584.1 oxygen-independent coproporphyrinogen III oxidase [Nitrosomonadales bacterium]MBT7482595.1 oxygen-independent coproporphyrinogen III oxidase [Nitrosomonadales bacterium]
MIKTIIEKEILNKYEVKGPRYTSYPTINNFNDVLGNENKSLTKMLKFFGHIKAQKPISLYVHIPFCDSLCYYCACNKIITKNKSHADIYLDYIQKEWELYKNIFHSEIEINSLHLGGGTPTFLTNEQLRKLISIFNPHSTSQKIERSIEIDPRTVNKERLRLIRDLGFNRISFGVQDLDISVQRVVNREQSYEEICSLISAAKKEKFHSINIDLIYGLPLQTKKSFSTTLKKIIGLKPDRIALYSYAHLPKIFKSQRSIESDGIPSSNEKISMLENAIDYFNDAGYEYIGMDHFALPHDEISMAKKQGRLFRNFQGYTLHNDNIVGLGASSISQYDSYYYQNEKNIKSYYSSIDNNKVPITKLFSLNKDDLLRREVIMKLMCQGFIDFKELENIYNIYFHQYFNYELKLLDEFQKDKLVKASKDSITITKKGWYFIRSIAMVFDSYLRSSQDLSRFSKVF